MKTLTNLITITLLLITSCCFSQQESTDVKTPPIQSIQVKQLPKDYSKFLGKYFLRIPSRADSVFIFDRFNIYEKNGQLLCSRDSKTRTLKSGNIVSKEKTFHCECELTFINEAEEKIGVKFLNKNYSYKFVKNSKGHYEIIMINSSMVYEQE